jgi:hypothetical protein
MTVNDFENLAVGFVLGMLGSVFTWFLIARMYKPKFEVSAICRSLSLENDRRDIVYRVKVLNKRSGRALTDLNIECRVFIQGLIEDADRGTNFTSFRIPIGDGSLFPFIDKGGDRIYNLRFRELEGAGTSRLPEGVLEQVRNAERSLEQLLRITGQKAYVRMVVTGADDFSGFRGSKPVKATVGEIVPGTFPRRNSVEIKEIEEFKETAEELAEQPGDLRGGSPSTDLEEGLAQG